MGRPLLLFLALIPGLARAGSAPAPVVSDALDRAEAALMDGDFDQAASLASRAAGPEAARILGEALEAQGDLKGAAAAYAEASQGPGADSAWLQKRARSLQAAAAAAEPTPQPTRTPSVPPTPQPTSTPTLTAAPTLQATPSATSVASPVPTAVPSPQATQTVSDDDKARQALEKEKLDLARERQELEDEKARMAQERRDLKKKSFGSSQGMTFYWGGGAYWPSAIEKLNEDANQSQGGSSSGGDAARVHVSWNKVLGLRWNGFAVEGEFLEQSLAYNNSRGIPGDAKVNLNMVSFGYDWAFIRRGTLLGPLELALPLRVELGQANIEVNGQSQSTGVGGPAVGLSLRCWATPRFMIEAQGLYHYSPDGNGHGDQNGGNGGNNNGGSSGGQNGTEGLAQDGFEARLSLGWRLF
jgi:hypothetical protein